MTEWTRGSKYHQTNGTHSVCAVKVLRLEDTTIGVDYQKATGKKGKWPNVGGELVWGFEAWRTRCNPAVFLGAYDTAEEARKRCEEDAECAA